MESKKQQEIEHLDERNHNFFMLDNEIIDDYKLSVDADSLYMLIVRRAQHKKTCYPSIRRWMKEKRRRHEKAKSAVNELVDKGLIKIEGRQRAGGAFVYRLLPVNKGVSPSETGKINPLPRGKRGASASETGGVSTVGTEEYKVNKTKKKTNIAVDKSPAPFQILAVEWCEFVKIDIKELTAKDWKAIHLHIKKGADINQLMGLSGEAYPKMKFDLTYLYGVRASLLPKIKPKDEKTFFTVEDMEEQNKE